jgi:hypothetical protein
MAIVMPGGGADLIWTTHIRRHNPGEIEMQNLPTAAIDWGNVNWLYVAVLAVLVFFRP